MNRTVRDRWVTALRSGEYRQTTGTFEREGAYCALGVLCVANDQPAKILDNDRLWSNFDYVESVLSKSSAVAVAMRNDDDRLTLPEIADWVEDNIPVEES